MNQSTLTTALTWFWHEEFSSLVDIQQIEAGDLDNPPWVTVLTAVEVEIQEVTAAERQAKEADYSHPVTHQGFCVTNADVQVGRRLVETHEKLESGIYQLVTTPRTFEILGMEKIIGVPGPHDQWRLDLVDMGPTLNL